VLDGHIVLSRSLAEAAVYPPIDVAASLSRPMPGLVGAAHHRLATRFRALWARRQEKQDIIDIGAYAPGRDPLLDEAIRRGPMMEKVIRQSAREAVTLTESRARLEAALAEHAS
jgi:flagellum-specific ATP synthase